MLTSSCFQVLPVLLLAYEGPASGVYVFETDKPTCTGHMRYFYKSDFIWKLDTMRESVVVDTELRTDVEHWRNMWHTAATILCHLYFSVTSRREWSTSIIVQKCLKNVSVTKIFYNILFHLFQPGHVLRKSL